MQSRPEIAAGSHVLRTLLGPAIVHGTLAWPRTTKAWGSRYLTVTQILTLASLLQSKEAGDKHGLRSKRMKRQTHGPSVKPPMHSHCCVLQEVARASALFRGDRNGFILLLTFRYQASTQESTDLKDYHLKNIICNQSLICHKPPSKTQEHISAP